MAACDICRITTACTSVDELGELTTPNSGMLLMLSACQYNDYCHYMEHFNYFANNKRVRAWCEVWNLGFEF